MVCGGRNNTYRYQKSVFKLFSPEFEYKHYALMPYARYNCKTAVINSEIFIFNGFSRNIMYDKQYLSKFCHKNKTRSSNIQMSLNDDKFCLCSIKKNLYVISRNSFDFYNLKKDHWIQKSNESN